MILIFTSFNSVCASELANKKKEVVEIEKEYNKALNELEQLDRGYNELNIELSELTQEIKNLDLHIIEKEDNINKLKIELNEKIKKMNEALKVMYVNGQLGYLELLLSLEGKSESMSRYEIAKLAVEQNKSSISDMEIIKKEIVRETDSLMIKKDILEKNKDEVKNKQKKISDLYGDKQDLINKLHNDKENTERTIKKMYEEIERNNRNASKNYKSNYSGGKLAYPLPGHTRISSPYGTRIHPVTGERRMHTGIDIPAPTGTNILAAEDGIVSTSGWLGGYGNTVIIVHDNSLSTLYAHNSRLLVKQGDIVKKGDVIAKVGSTGRSTGPHLHFEVRNKNNTHQNPFNYLQ